MSQLASSSLRRTKVLSAYRSLLRTAYQWPIFEVTMTHRPNMSSKQQQQQQQLQYDNVRDYLIDTIREEFHASKNDTDVDIIHDKIKRAEREIKNMNILLNGRMSKAFPVVRDYKVLKATSSKY